MQAADAGNGFFQGEGLLVFQLLLRNHVDAVGGVENRCVYTGDVAAFGFVAGFHIQAFGVHFYCIQLAGVGVVGISVSGAKAGKRQSKRGETGHHGVS